MLECFAERRKKYFNDEKSAAQFAAIYLIRNFDISTVVGKPLDRYSASFSNNKWHLNVLDEDNFIRKSLLLLDNQIEDLNVALRAAISIGLDKIYEKNTK